MVVTVLTVLISGGPSQQRWVRNASFLQYVFSGSQTPDWTILLAGRSFLGCGGCWGSFPPTCVSWSEPVMTEQAFPESRSSRWQRRLLWPPASASRNDGSFEGIMARSWTVAAGTAVGLDGSGSCPSGWELLLKAVRSATSTELDESGLTLGSTSSVNEAYEDEAGSSSKSSCCCGHGWEIARQGKTTMMRNILCGKNIIWNLKFRLTRLDTEAFYYLLLEYRAVSTRFSETRGCRDLGGWRPKNLPAAA